MNPVITIVGLRYGQPRHVKDKCKRLADLKFLGGEGDKANMPKCDYIILMTRFLRHSWTWAAYDQFPRSRVHTHPGGMSSLVERIEQISETFNKEEDREARLSNGSRSRQESGRKAVGGKVGVANAH